MKLNYLFPNRYKKIGWTILVPSSIIGLLILIFDVEPSFMEFKVPAIFIDETFGEKHLIGMTANNVLNEIIGVLIIISLLFVAFSKEPVEDEFISQVRLKSLVWATYVNYSILLFSFVFIFDISFLWVMIFNMFTVLLFFIIRFHWQLAKLNKSTGYEE